MYATTGIATFGSDLIRKTFKIFKFVMLLSKKIMKPVINLNIWKIFNIDKLFSQDPLRS